MARSMKEVHTINYYPINEGAARRAKEMNSFSDYKEGSATAEYRAMVDKAAAIAEQQKSRVDPMYHEKIDHLLDTYARKLAENMNQGFAIDARVPSVMIAGPANFPVGKKEKQNRARDSNMEEWRYIQGLLDIQSPAFINGNKLLIEKVFSNLISNAVKYSPHGASVDIILQNTNGRFLFSVENTGTHIPEDDIPKLFDAFYRMEQSRSRRTGGSGLGLYMVQRILQQHNSYCEACNTENGVKFFFTI